jgi:hypothetical protein
MPAAPEAVANFLMTRDELPLDFEWLAAGTISEFPKLRMELQSSVSKILRGPTTISDFYSLHFKDESGNIGEFLVLELESPDVAMSLIKKMAFNKGCTEVDINGYRVYHASKSNHFYWANSEFYISLGPLQTKGYTKITEKSAEIVRTILEKTGAPSFPEQ